MLRVEGQLEACDVSGGGRLPVSSSIIALPYMWSSAWWRSSCACRSSGVRWLILFLFFLSILVLSADVREYRFHVDVDVGQNPHHRRHFAAIDPLLFLHSSRVPGRVPARKVPSEAS